MTGKLQKLFSSQSHELKQMRISYCPMKEMLLFIHFYKCVKVGRFVAKFWDDMVL
jgi:hypothetical protein